MTTLLENFGRHRFAVQFGDHFGKSARRGTWKSFGEPRVRVGCDSLKVFCV